MITNLIEKYYNFFKNDDVIKFYNTDYKIIEKQYDVVKLFPIDGIIFDVGDIIKLMEIWITENEMYFIVFENKNKKYNMLKYNDIKNEYVSGVLNVFDFFDGCIQQYFSLEFNEI